MRRICWLLLTLSTVLLLGSTSSAQNLPIPNPGSGTTALTSDWQFHTGDDPAWAAVAFNDTRWERLTADAPWGSQGHAGYHGFAWYRRHVEVDGPGPALAILIPPIDDAYEIFWNGQKIGTYGNLPPQARWFAFGHASTFDLPGTADGAAHGELAIRVWKAPFYLLDDPQGGGFEDAPRVGEPSVLTLMRKAPEDTFAIQILPRATTGFLLGIAGLIAAALWWIGRTNKADTSKLLLWLAGFLVSTAAYTLMWLPPFHFGWSATANELGTLLTAMPGEPCLWYLFLAIFGLGARRSWRRITAFLTVAYVAATLGDGVVVLLWGHLGAHLRPTDDALSWIATILPLYSLVIIAFGLRKRRYVTHWPLAAAVVITEAYGLLVTCSQQSINLGSNMFALLTKPHLVLGPYAFSIHTLLNISLSFVLIVTVMQVQARQQRRQVMLEQEMKSAREVQQVIIPEEVPATPGFSVATAYQPAAEVGGDFYQVLPVADGLLIVLGDVSGKGLAAAMTVSLIVGTLRTLAEIDPGPAAMLRGLNRRLLGRTRNGFVTCIALHVAPSGAMRLANAGHLPPFLDHTELMLPPALPLGITSDLDIEEETRWLRPGERLTLYTDGLLEARNARGELYGFDRVAQLLTRRPSVEEIVITARNFGQDDDITVLTLMLSPAMAPADAQPEARANLVTTL